MANNMLPILLLGGAALFLMSRGGDEDGGGPIGEPIDKDVEALSNVTLWKPSETEAEIENKVPFPVVTLASTGWSLEEISVRMKSTIESNPDVHFLFTPIDIAIHILAEQAGVPSSALSAIPNIAVISSYPNGFNEYEVYRVDGLDWSLFDEDLVLALAYAKASASVVSLDRGLAFRSGAAPSSPNATQGRAGISGGLQSLFG